MTTYNDDLQDRVLRFGPLTNEEGREPDLYADPSGVYPLFGTWGLPTTPLLSYGARVSELANGGASPDTRLSLGEPLPSFQNRNRVISTPGGHSIELDDTPGNDRILVRHNNGRGIEIRPDGSMSISAGRQVITVAADQTVVIEGDATLVYSGNVRMQVAGDYEVSVGGNYNVTVDGNKGENVNGSSRYTAEGNWGSVVKGSHSQTNLGTSTTTNLGDMNNITAGAARINAEGNMQIATGGTGHISASNNMFISSDNMNVAASDLSVFGATGAIGGEGIFMYGFNGEFQESVYATAMQADTFYGDLEGTARDAQEATIAGSTGSVTVGALTTTALNAAVRALPNAANVNAYLNSTSVGAISVRVDIDGHFRRSLDRTDATGGLSTRDLSTEEIRALLRSPDNRDNEDFVAGAVASGRLSPTYTRTTPGQVGRVTGQAPESYRGATEIGTPTSSTEFAEFLSPDDNTPTTFATTHQITDTMTITMATVLATGVNIATYAGGTGQTARLDLLPQAELPQIARNLQPNAEILRRIRTDTDADFVNYRMVVVEGLYNPPPPEREGTGWEGSINRMKHEGRAAVYELHNTDGEADPLRTYDLAIKLKNVTVFEKLILDYDTYDPSGELNAQIIIQMPELSEDYEVTEGDFGRAVETRFNGNVVSDTDLVEVNAEGEIVPQTEEERVAAITGNRTETEARNVDARVDALDLPDDVREQVRQDLAGLPGYTAVVYNGDVYYVSQDYYDGPVPEGVGHSGAVSLDGARAIAEANGAILPSEGLVREIQRSADVQITANPNWDRYGGSDAGIDRYNDAVERQLASAGVQSGQLVSGYAKDFTSTGGFLGLWQNGSAIQGTNRETPFTSVHGSNYYDYSQRVRLVRPLGRDAETGQIIDFR